MVCPDGWHLPSDLEWEELANYVSSHSGLTIKDGSYWTQIGKLLKSVHANGTDDYGFSVLMSGHRGTQRTDGSGERWVNGGLTATFWSSTEACCYVGNGHAFGQTFDVNQEYFGKGPTYTEWGHPIRCLKD